MRKNIHVHIHDANDPNAADIRRIYDLLKQAEPLAQKVMESSDSARKQRAGSVLRSIREAAGHLTYLV